MGELDLLLKQLALEAQQHPPLSAQRQSALTRLLTQILSSGQLAHPQRGRWPSCRYRELYSDALQQTCLYLCQNIEHYRPEHPVMAWVNNTLGYKFKDAVKAAQPYSEVTLPSLEELDRKFRAYQPKQVDGTLERCKLLKQFLLDDPEGLLRRESIRSRPEITFQTLAVSRFIEDQTWAMLSQKMGIPLQTLCSFYNRRLRKLMPYFQKHLQD